MASAEQEVMRLLGWKGSGLIDAVGATSSDTQSLHPHEGHDISGSSSGGGDASGTRKMASATGGNQKKQGVEQQEQPRASAFRKRPVVRGEVGGSQSGGTLGVLGAVFGASPTAEEGQEKVSDTQDVAGRNSRHEGGCEGAAVN
jgi:hypothetical protein